MQSCQKKQLCRKVEYEKFNAVESKRKYLPNFSSSFVSSELKVITNQKNSERGQLTTDEDRNYQINGSHEDISSVH